MKIGVVSDSHDNLVNTGKAINALNESNVSLVVHLGDYVAPFTVRRFGELLKVKLIGVFGNNDGDKYLLLSTARRYGFEIYEPPYELSIGGRSVLIMHGYGSKELTRSLIHSLGLSGRYDVIMYGHTHELHIETINKSLVVNPGEVFGCLSGEASIVVLDLERLRAEVVRL